MDFAKFIELGALPGHYFIRISQAVSVSAANQQEPQSSRMQGELHYIVGLPDNNASSTSVKLTQLGLMSSGARTKRGRSGQISIFRVLESEGNVSPQKEFLAIKLKALVEVTTEALLMDALGARREIEKVDELLYRERMELILDASLTPLENAREEGAVATLSGILNIQRISDNGRTEIGEITVDLKDVTVYRLSQSTDLNHAPLYHRQIKVQPITFADSENDKAPTGSTFSQQLDMANKLWGPGCIEFIVNNPSLPPIVDSGLKKSDDLFALVERAMIDQFGNVVLDLGENEPKIVLEIYVVDNELKSINGQAINGGLTIFSGTGLDKILVSDICCISSDPVLLAHELGHTLAFHHPNEVDIGLSEPSPETLMNNISSGQSHLSENTLKNCRIGHNVAQITVTPLEECSGTTMARWRILDDGTVASV